MGTRQLQEPMCLILAAPNSVVRCYLLKSGASAHDFRNRMGRSILARSSSARKLARENHADWNQNNINSSTMKQHFLIIALIGAVALNPTAWAATQQYFISLEPEGGGGRTGGGSGTITFDDTLNTLTLTDGTAGFDLADQLLQLENGRQQRVGSRVPRRRNLEGSPPHS